MGKEKKSDNIMWYLLIGFFILLIESFVLGQVMQNYPELIYLNDKPFPIQYFVTGMTALFLVLLVYLLGMKNRRDL